MIPSLSTSIEPASVEQLDALIEGPAAFEQRFDLAVADGYLDFPEALAPSRDALLEGVPAQWLSHLIVSDGTLVGFGGYKGPPVGAEVEIGYSIAPAHRARGHATAVVGELVRRARAAGVEHVSAHTLPESNASTRVLERCGFELAGTEEHPAEGPVWRWRREA